MTSTTTPDKSIMPQQRYLLTQLGDVTVVFPLMLVSEMLILVKSQILPLPFYDKAVLGCVHKKGQIIPLVSLQQVMGVETGVSKEKLTVVVLNEQAGNLVGVGLVVDKLLASLGREELPPEVFNLDISVGEARRQTQMWLFHSKIMSEGLWQPQRYQPFDRSKFL